MTPGADLDRALLNLAANGRRVRCAEPADHAWWTSDDDADRARAAVLCQGCPVAQACRAAGDDSEEVGVYGGIDRGMTPPKRRKRAA